MITASKFLFCKHIFNYFENWDKNPWIYLSLCVKVSQSCPTLCNSIDYTVHGILQARILKWAAFPFSRWYSQPQGSNPGLPHCRWILYQLSHKGSPRILEWVAYPSSSAFSWPRNGTRVSCITGRFFTNWAINTDIIMMGKTEKLGFPKDCLKQHLDGVLTLLLHTEC